MGGYLIYIIIGGVFSLIGAAVQSRLKSKFKKYSKVGLRSGLSGKEIAEKMLDHYGISDVKITKGEGFLSDHYNPKSKTVNLSPAVYQGRSIASAAIAAHECGHAIQHDTSYGWLQMRSTIVPIVSVASKAQQWLLMLALFGFGASMQAGSTILLITIIAFAITTIFSLITLPVEFDASKRALAWLDNSNFTEGKEQEGAKDALWWAAMTYVVAALSSLAMLLWLVMSFLGGE